MDEKIVKSIEVLKSGGVVATPSVSSYGLSADATNPEAVKKIFKIKERSESKTPILLVSSLSMAERYGVFSSKMRNIARKFWPGALTIVVPVQANTDLAREVIHHDKTIALRMTPFFENQLLINDLACPITSTSANQSDEKPIYSSEEIKKRLTLMPDYILDRGLLQENPPSTIITETNGKIDVLRQGQVTINPINIA